SAFCLQSVQGGLVGDVAPLTALERDQDLLAGVETAGPRGVDRLHRQPLVPAAEVQVLVTGERSGQEVRFAQDLEPVADPEHRHTATGSVRDRGHHRGESGNRAAAQIVAVRETAGQDDGVDSVQLVISVPQGDRLSPGVAHRPSSVPIVERAGEGDDTYPHEASSATFTANSSIIGLASSRSAISWTFSRSGSPANSSSIRRPMRTEVTSVTPRRGSAAATACPCGSRISG